MSANTIDLTEHNNGLPCHKNEDNFDDSTEFWQELYFNSFEESAHASHAYQTASIASPGPIDPAICCANPRPSYFDPHCFSPTTTASTAQTTVNGDNGSGEDMYETIGSQKRRDFDAASSIAPRTVAGDRRTSDIQQEGSRRKSMSEPVKRERNRAAAAKCRAKNRVAEQDLQETQRIERERNVELRAIAKELSNESLMLRNELLSHANCDHPIINKYLNRTADQIGRAYGVPTQISTSRGNDPIHKS